MDYILGDPTKRRFEKNSFESKLYSLPVVIDFFKLKILTYLTYMGPWGLLLLKAINPDELPLPFETNFSLKLRR
jgi:hypothetical protein